MNEVRHLHELEVIFKGAINFPGVLMLHAIASVFEGIEAFILDFPAQASCPTGIGNIAALMGKSVMYTKHVVFSSSSGASVFVGLMVSLHSSQFNVCPL